jgi:sugar phosphate isomerase/epimerase
MKLGLFTALLSEMPLDAVIRLVKPLGIQALEFSTGNFGRPAHIDLGLAGNPGAAKEFKTKLEDQGLEISALNCGGNVLHPNSQIAKAHIETCRKTILLAETLGIRTVINFSGCPGDCENSKYPNFVSTSWPPDFPEILKWQWEEKVLPFWTEHIKFAADHGVRVALEMHPGFVVYSPETLTRLREQVGVNLGCNLDPSHLFWQGIDPCLAVRALGPAIFHVHAKDTKIYSANASLNGTLDTKPYGDEERRSWLFRTVGYGHGSDFWSDFISTLEMIGYDHVLSIEHEDSLISVENGLAKATSFLSHWVIKEKLKTIWWT